jgi:hypothetical protein
VPTIALFVPAFAEFLSNTKTHAHYITLYLATACAWNSITYSQNLIINTWEHRKKDHLFFKYLVNECNLGKKLYWLSDPWLEKNDPDYGHFDGVMCLNRYQHFLNYYGEFKYAAERVFDFDRFNKNSLIICGARTVQSHLFPPIYNKLKELGFEKVKTFDGSSGALVFAYQAAPR